MKCFVTDLVTVFALWWTYETITGEVEYCHRFVNNTVPKQSEDFMKEIEPCGYLQCTRECFLASKCVGIIYRKHELFCGLATSTSLSKNAALYGVFDEQFLGACNQMDCKMTETCVPLSRGRGVCIDTVSCPSNWIRFQSGCLFFSNDSRAWSDAKLQCEMKGSSLVTISTEAIYTFIQDKVSTSDKEFWIGSVKDSTGSWIWTETNRAIIFHTWMNVDISGFFNENCMRIMFTGQLLDKTCDAIYNYICHR